MVLNKINLYINIMEPPQSWLHCIIIFRLEDRDFFILMCTIFVHFLSSSDEILNDWGEPKTNV